jgi:hypothetical protein
LSKKVIASSDRFRLRSGTYVEQWGIGSSLVDNEGGFVLDTMRLKEDY